VNNPITLWYKWIKDKKGNYLWDFNHLEDGHCLNDTPTPKFPNQKAAWSGCKWQAEHAQLVGGVVHKPQPN
jgi:hypothetical protein